MANKYSFDKAAESYDKAFTHSTIGTYLRKRVWNYMDKSFDSGKKVKVLELNCGTGEDAIYLAKKGYNVTASDISPNMLETARSKVLKAGSNLNINFEQVDIRKLKSHIFPSRFDIVFSDFGGFNCISPEAVSELFSSLKNNLTQNGRVIAVIMSKHCLWEIILYLLKRDIKKSFRRFRNEFLNVNVSGIIQETYYYSPSGFQKLCCDNFNVVKVFPVGLFLPPTYMESFFRNKPGTLKFLYKLESFAGNTALFSLSGDHFLIDLKVKG